MHPDQFADSAPGKLFRSGAGNHAYWYYVPGPLPPQLTYDQDVMRAFGEAERAVGELSGLGRVLENPHILVRPFLRREAVASSRIEGTESDLADLYAYEAGQRPGPDGPPEADVREVLNYVHALEYGLERLADLPVCLRLLREVHERLLAGVRGTRSELGEFRGTQNWIGPPGCTLNQATYVPPAVPEMRECLDALDHYLHAPAHCPDLVRLALIHYQFEAIHPFLDGNGRIGRLLIALLMVHWQMLPLPLLYVSPYFERHRQQYYDGLLAVSARGAWEEWVGFFLRAISEESVSAANRAKRLQDLQVRWKDEVARTRAPALVMRAVDLLFTSPMITIPETARELGTTYHTARRCVERLIDQGILQPVEGTSNPVFVVASDIIAVVQGTEGEEGL